MFFFSFLQRWIYDYDSKETFLKYAYLACIFFCIIGIYSIMMPIKDTIFLKTVGIKYLSLGKTFAVLVIIPLLFLYSHLTSYIPRHRLLCAVGLFYACVTLLCFFVLIHPTWGLANQVLSPYRLVGWIWYACVESFGSIMVTTFWGFAADISQPESAKRGFSLISLGAQTGGFLMPLIFRNKAKVWGPLPFFFIIIGGMIVIVIFTFYFTKITPPAQLKGFEKNPSSKPLSSSFLEGLLLVIKEPYLRGICMLVASYEIILIFFEIQLKAFANACYLDINSLNGFFFEYSLYSNGIALSSLLLGSHNIRKYTNITVMLLITPALTLGMLILTLISFDLNTFFYCIVITRGINYSLNQPTKEQLYIPTASSVKYKAKAWIDIFGARFGKSAGSSLHLLQPMLHSIFSRVTTGIIAILLGLWAYSVWYVGKKYDKAIKENNVVDSR